MRRTLSLFLICVFALVCVSGTAKERKKKIRWTPIPTQDHNVEAEVGALLTCTYKIVDAGQRFEHVDKQNGLKVQVIKPAGGDLEFTLFWNHKLPRKKINNEAVADALQGAVDGCFEKLYGEEYPE